MDIVLISGFREMVQEGNTVRRLLDAGIKAAFGNCPVSFFETKYGLLALVNSNSSLVCNIRKKCNLDSGLTFEVVASANDLDSIELVASEDLRLLGSESPVIRGVFSQAEAILDIYNDGVGFLESYYYYSETYGFIFSTRLDALIATMPKLLWEKDALCEYLSFLHPLDQSTLIEGVKILPGGGHLTYAFRRGLRVTSRSLINGDTVRPDASVGFLVEEFSFLWKRAMTRINQRTSKPKYLGLSGGLDSRAIAEGLSSVGCTPTCITYGRNSLLEVSVARLVAESLELPHLLLPIRPQAALERLSERAGMLSGSQTLLEMYELWFEEYFKNIGGSFISGISGDIYWGNDSAFGIPYGADLLGKVYSRYFREIASIKTFLKDDLSKNLEEIARCSLDRTLSRHSNVQNGDASTFWNLCQRQTRWGFSHGSAMRQMGFVFENPFFDSEFVKFAASIPANLRGNGRLLTEVYRNCFPVTSGIYRSRDFCRPIDLKGLLYYRGDRSSLAQLFWFAIGSPISGAKKVMAHLMDKPLKTISRVLPWKNLFLWAVSRNDLFPKDLLYWNMRGLKDPLKEELLDLLRDLPPFFDENMVKNVINEIDGDSSPSYRSIGKVVTVSHWDRRWRSLRSESKCEDMW